MSGASANLNLMIKAARKAGRALVRDFNEVENLQVSVKGAGDFVSAADRRSEQIIHDMLREARPAYGWLGEESGEEKGRDDTRRWIVDPLDGTTNFLHGLPHWAISIALEHKGKIVAGVVFDPAKDEIFVAEAGQGCWANDRRARVSARRDLGAALLGTGVPWGTKRSLPDTLKDLAALMPRTAGIRRWGVASLDLAYVATGRLDGYWEREVNAWDVAAGDILVREAGGLVGAPGAGAGRGDPVGSGSILATNAELYTTLDTTLSGR
ncbi:MAG: inositol monophosphatase family protein [Pseudomonadota bacterium]